MVPKIKVCGYTRVSTLEQAEKGESLITQKEQIRNYIKDLKDENWVLYKIYSDEGATGTKIDYRTGFQQMINDAKSKKFEAIVFTKTDRFARNTRDFLNVADELDKIGIRLISIKERFDTTTPMGKMLRTILASFAEWEHGVIRERMSENKSARWNKGQIFLGTPPFGYNWNPTLKKLEFNPIEVPIYHEIVKMCAKQNYPLRDIANELNDRGLIPDRVLKDGRIKKKRPWSSVSVSHVIKNPCYYGHYVLNKTLFEDGRRGAGTKHTKKPKPDSKHISFPIDPIITKQEWDEMQDKIELHKTFPKHINETTLNSYLRSSLICGRCESRMLVKQGNKLKSGIIMRYYACPWTSPGKKALKSNQHKKCDLPYISADKLEQDVWWSLRILFKIDSPDSRQKLNKVLEPDVTKESIDKLIEYCLTLENELSRLESKRKNIKRLLDDEDFDKDEFSKMLNENDKEKLTTVGRLEKSKKELDKKRKLLKDAESLKDYFNRNERLFEIVEQEINKLSLADRKLLIESMLEDLIVVNWVPEDQSYKDPLALSRKGKQAPGLHTHIKWKINPEILNRFIDEGKINGLNKDSSQCCHRY